MPPPEELPPVTVQLEKRLAELERKLADSSALEPAERAKLVTRIDALEKELAAKKAAPPAEEPPPKKKPGALPWW